MWENVRMRWRLNPWNRVRGDYWVSDDDGWCAGNLTRGFALRYAEGRASLKPGRMCVVVRRDSKDVLHVVAEFPSPKT